MPDNPLLPANTALDRALIEGATFTDSHCVALSRGDASMVDIFFAIFGHHPAWLKALLLVRHRCGAWFGLEAASAAQVLNPTQEATYRVGQAIGPWPLYFLGESELVAGRDNKHLDFRLSVLKHGTGPAAYATVTTVCRVHNRFGRAYLRVIAPFHTWGVRRLLSRASRAGRL
ncbi:MAG: DUF2867 domain-containing protein [Burkholderiales bacterium]|nr:DUF2867 domain-containing protein [Burkholderiales bacterium]